MYLALPFPLARTAEIAAVLAAGAGAVLSHLNALALWDIGPAPAGPDVEVSVVGHRGRRRGIRLHRVDRLDEDERTVRQDIPVTTPGRTLVDAAALLSRRELEAAVARADRERLVTFKAFSALVARHRGRRGIPALEAVLGLAGGPALTRSAAEEAFLALLRKAGLPMPEVNARVGHYEVDFLWRRSRIAVEIDGFRYHSSHSSFEGDRRRDAQLAAAGLAVIRLSWRQITQEAMATAVQLGQALARAGPR